MKQYLLTICLVVSGLFPTHFAFASADITQLVFVTDKQTVALDILSSEITVQTQNSSGEFKKLDEKADLIFTSTSAKGQFLNTDGDSEVQKYMSTGSYNKHFTYKDSIAGVPTITVRATGSVSGKIWQAEQQITIGSGGSTATTSTTTTTTTVNVSGGGGVADTPPRSQLFGGIKLHVPKQVNVHSPNYYWAETEHFEGVPDMFWNFGDGTSAQGSGAWHTYEHIGRYVLSVRAPSVGAQVVARNVVEVVEPKVSIANAEAGLSGFVELSNPSSNDLDISGYGLASGRRNFRIPEGTFVLGNGSAFITNRISGLDLADSIVVLNAQDGTRLASFSLVAPVPTPGQMGTVLGTSTVSVANLQKSLVEMHDMLVNMKIARETSPTASSGPTVLPLAKSVQDPQASSSNVVVINRKVGLFSRLFSFFR